MATAQDSIVASLATVTTAPLRVFARLAGATETLDYEAARWVRELQIPEIDGLAPKQQFAWLVARRREFRNLVHYRLLALPLPLRLMAKSMYPQDPTLTITAEHIGRGLVIQHGFATIITAQTIGEDCWVNQQVTIGWGKSGPPTIGDRVRIATGAVVIGTITIGDDARIGANATVMRDVPAGATMVAPLAVELQQQVPVRARLVS